MELRGAYRYRSFFWPALLILAGVVALLVNVGAMPVDRLYQLADLWPVVLIVIGLELVVRRSVQGVMGDVAAALILLLAVVGAAGYLLVAPNPSATRTLDAASSTGTLDQAAVALDVGAATIDMSGSPELGSDLYRAHIEYSGPEPQVAFDPATGNLKISQPNGTFFQSRKFTIKLQLNVAVPWTVTENTGASSETINFSQLHASSLTVNTGASHEDITLGPLSGTVPASINGGALTVHVHRPAGVATSIQVSGGAVSLTADGRSFHAIGSAGFTADGYGDANDRYRITVNGGACNVTLDTTAPLA